MRFALSAKCPAARLHAEAIWKLLLGNSEARFDEAVSGLGEAHALVPGDRDIVIDLAATYLVRAAHENDPRDLLAAVAWSEKALQLDPAAVEARFNLALALEKLHLYSQAQAAWADYIKHDGESAWAVEAQARSEALEGPSFDMRWQEIRRTLAAEPVALPDSIVLGDFVQQARLYIEDEVLPAWADAATVGDSLRAALELRRAAKIAQMLAVESSDTLLDDSVTITGESGSSSFSFTRRRNLIDGYRLYRDGRRLYEEQNHDAAKPVLEQSRVRLESAGSSLALWAAFYIAVCDYHASDYSLALRQFRSLLARVSNSTYPSLRGHAAWMIGLTQLDRARYADAVLAFQRALGDFRTAHETENVAAMHNLLSRGFEALGDDLEAWRHRYAALARLTEVGKSRRVSNILSSAVDGAVEEGLLSVASRFQLEMVRQTRLSGNPLLLTIALHKDAALAARLGHHREAVAALSEAKIWCERIAGSGVRARVTADLLLAEGEVMRGADAKASLAVLQRALALFREQDARVRLITAERQRARTHEAMGDAVGAGIAYRAAIAEAEAQIDSVPQVDLLSFAVEMRELYDAFIAYAANHEDAERLFFWCERAREVYLRAALASLRLTGAGEASVRPALVATPSLAAVRAALPQGVILVEFKLLSDRILRWTLTSAGMRFRQTPVDPAALAQEAASLRQRIRQGSSLADLRAPLTRLGRLTLGEMEDELSSGRVLVAVPDGPLATLPFDLLIPPADHRPLVERLPVLSAPSAGLFLASTARIGNLGEAPPRTALILGNPSFDRSLFPRLPALLRGGAEARRIGTMYPQASVFTEHAATSAVLKRQAPTSEVVHFAGHAVFNNRAVWHSSLLLAQDPEVNDSGMLTIRDLAHLRLPRTRLVVLAACDTAGSDTAVSDSVPALLVPFLAAGVPSLVASLWEVDDNGASSLLIEEFHRRVAAGESPAIALREAKLLLLHAPEESLRVPATWAPFTLIGGVTPDM